MKKPLKEKRSPGTVLCAVYLALLFVLLPLVVHQAYYDITLTKAVVFWTLSALLTAGCAVWLLTSREARAQLTLPAAAELLFAVFALTQIVSTLLFRPIGPGITAPDNRYQGIASFALYLLSFMLLRRYARFDSTAQYALLLGCSAAALLAVFEVFGLDLLGMRAISPALQRPRFFSTVGNISFLSALCVLMLPVCLCLAVSADSSAPAAAFGGCGLVFLCCGIAMRAETFVLGALACYALLAVFIRSARALRRLPLLCALSALAVLLFTLAMKRWGLYRLSDLTALLSRPVILLALAVLFLGLWLLGRRADDASWLRARRVYCFLLAGLILALAIFLVLANTVWRSRLSEQLASVVVFSPSWGSDRGKEWLSFWKMFREAPLLKKLIGSGAGSLAEWDFSHRLFPDAITDSAHNEYLHYLLTGGILGLSAYLGVLALALCSSFQRPGPVRTALALGAACYAVQAMVNIAQPFTTPLFFTVLALLCSESAPDTEPGGSERPIFSIVGLTVLAAALLVWASAMVSRC